MSEAIPFAFGGCQATLGIPGLGRSSLASIDNERYENQEEWDPVPVKVFVWSFHNMILS